jgi:hypothetical protein
MFGRVGSGVRGLGTWLHVFGDDASVPHQIQLIVCAVVALVGRKPYRAWPWPSPTCCLNRPRWARSRWIGWVGAQFATRRSPLVAGHA